MQGIKNLLILHVAKSPKGDIGLRREGERSTMIHNRTKEVNIAK